ncbi:MAG: hypothetical protein ACJ72L_18580 [Marmoricola sp.]
MAKINGYPHSYYLVGVIVVFVVVGLGQTVAAVVDVGGWIAAAIWVGSVGVGFVAARHVNALLFRTER